jgi:membrane-bound lytic murein transglycosylase D
MRRVLLALLLVAAPSSAAPTAPAPPPKSPAPAVPKKAPPKAAPTAKKTTTPAPAPAKRAGVDDTARRQIAGGPSADDALLGPDSVELRALHAAERELFPIALPSSGAPELPYPLAAEAPRVHATGLPPTPVQGAPPAAEGGRDLSWLAKLQLPDLPVRWDARLVRYLEFFKDDPRGHTMLAVWLRRAGRYKDALRRVFRAKGVPEDLVWLAMIESGFDPTARSPAGALGMWQFMGDTARAYGLSQDRWADQRLNVQLATEAAAEHLADLHRRFGAWDLAIAAYNMGYAGIVSNVRRYNTNDFWTLSRFEGALPWETTLYVPKFLAASIVAHNMGAFGFGDLVPDPPLDVDEVNVGSGVALADVAKAAGCTTKEIEALNPELRASRTPPAPGTTEYAVKVPAGRGAQTAQNLLKAKKYVGENYVVRFGETLEQIAHVRKVTVAKLVEMNGIAPGEVIRGGTTILVPKADPNAKPIATTTLAAQVPAPSGASTHESLAGAAAAPPLAPQVSSVVAVPADIFVYPDRRRVFYRVVAGDTLPQIAGAFHVSTDEVRRWNDLDPAARLQEGMTIQLFVPLDADLSSAVFLNESDVRVVTVGSEEFFAYHEGLKGKKRITVTAKKGETLEQIGRKYGVSAPVMERINRQNRGHVMKEGETVALYVNAQPGAPPKDPVASARPEPAPPALGPLPVAPMPDLLPRLP